MRTASTSLVTFGLSQRRFEGESFGKPGRTVNMRHFTPPSVSVPYQTLFFALKPPTAVFALDL